MPILMCAFGWWINYIFHWKQWLLSIFALSVLFIYYLKLSKNIFAKFYKL